MSTVHRHSPPPGSSPVGMIVDYFRDNLDAGEHTLRVYRCRCGALILSDDDEAALGLPEKETP